DLSVVIQLWRDDRRAEFEQFLDEVDRLLHNYVAAAGTLAEHTRRVWRRRPPRDVALSDECDRRVKETFDGPLPQFVKGMRNYTLHHRLPIARGRLSGRAGEAPVSLITIERNDLLKTDKWSKRAREYLASAPSEIDIAEVVEEYTDAVAGFND